jgi:trehalose-6-phosphate synthase
MDRLARRALADDPPDPGAPHLILGADRLDYTKGIHQRLLAVEQLLDRYPEHRGRIVFTQIAMPTRERVPEYGELKRQIDEAVGRINGRFSDRGWAPIRYLTRSLDPNALAGLYARTDVATAWRRRWLPRWKCRWRNVAPGCPPSVTGFG